MARAIEIGPYDYHSEFIPQSEYVSERRSLYKMENEMREVGFFFSFEDHLREVAGTFPKTDAIEVLDSGCGEGIALWDLKWIAEKIGQPIATTGISMARRHMINLENRLVDKPVIGTIQNYFVRGGFDRPIHFILDYHGALGNSLESIIGIYANVLERKGTGLFTLSTDITPESSKISWMSDAYYNETVLPIKRKTRNMLEQLGLSIRLAKGNYTMVEKQ